MRLSLWHYSSNDKMIDFSLYQYKISILFYMVGVVNVSIEDLLKVS